MWRSSPNAWMGKARISMKSSALLKYAQTYSPIPSYYAIQLKIEKLQLTCIYPQKGDYKVVYQKISFFISI